jgi:ribosomal protein S18 acetylase RimI-like enzyme
MYQNRIIGILVAEIKLKKVTDRDDYILLSSKHHENTQITYILSLGVFKDYRRLGIGICSFIHFFEIAYNLRLSFYFLSILASMLLDTLMAYLKNETDCKAIYLHVLWSNTNAIRFYEKRNFQRRIFLPKYYTIQGQFQDGYCYVLYTNNGQPPMSFTYPFLKFTNYFHFRSWF